MTKSEQKSDLNYSSEDPLSLIITEVADRICRNIDFESRPELHQRAEEWGQKHGLYRTEEANKLLYRLAAYDRLLKMSLYSLYKIDDSSLPPITGTHEIADRLEHARKNIDDAAFERTILDDLADAAQPTQVAPLLNNRHKLVDAEQPADEIARIFETLIPNEARRKLGQFRTPEYVADTMAEWSVLCGDDIVLDPGMGSGVLTSKMYQLKNNALA